MKHIAIAVLFCAMAVAGCAVNRGVVDIQVPKSANPSSPATVKIVEVTDERVFKIDPRQPYIPSLRDDEINDAKITTRAIARKRNSYGMALGDILLPPDRTVSQVVKEALEKALRDSGYRVVSKGEPGYESARPLKAEIREFWAWVTPGFWQISMEHKTRVQLNGDWPVANANREVGGYAQVLGFAGTTSMWRETFNKGVASFIGNMKGSIRKPPDTADQPDRKAGS